MADIPLIDGRSLKDQVTDVLQSAASELKQLNARHKGHAQVAFCLVMEVVDHDSGDTGWFYLSNVTQPLDFMADAAEQIGEHDGWEERVSH